MKTTSRMILMFLIGVLTTLLAIGMSSLPRQSISSSSGVTPATPPLTATTGAMGGGLLAIGGFNTVTVTVTGATTSQSCYASAQGGVDIGGGMSVVCWISAANTISVREVAIVALTPPSATFRVVVQ